MVVHLSLSVCYNQRHVRKGAGARVGCDPVVEKLLLDRWAGEVRVRRNTGWGGARSAEVFVAGESG